MNNESSLQQITEQRLQQTLSPIQVQYARALEMSAPEYEEEVRRTIDDNPALEIDTGSDPGSEEPRHPDEDSGGESAEQMQLADYASDEEVPHYRLNAENRSADDAVTDPTTTQAGTDTLLDSLETQIDMTDAPDRVKALARYAAGAIDSNGYLTRTADQMVDDLAFGLGVDVPVADMRRAVELLRTLDPPGIAAADLRQCLLLQAERLPESPRRDDTLLVLGHYFDMFANRHYDRLQSAAGLTGERLAGVLALVRTLSPKPGAAFGGTDSDDRLRRIVPDFETEADDNGRVTVTMPTGAPRLRVAESFDVTARRGGASDSEMAFIRRKRDEAADFIRASRMRHETLMRVMGAIVKLQHDFFVTGDPLKLHPMILKDVAALTGDDLSVVSRATAGKYVQTPAGIFPLKYFFNERPRDDIDASSHELLEALRLEIEAEDHRHPLSDQALSERLAAKGYDLARRTVTKYRERLGLPVARLRREL